MSQKPAPPQSIPKPQITPAKVFDPSQPRTKRTCSEKQLANLKAGREKSSLYKALKQKAKKRV
jgi:hypothetical protein